MESIIAMKRCPILLPTRRQLLRQSLMFGAGLAVGSVARASAAPPAAGAVARHNINLVTENQLMPEIMHLIKIRTPRDKAYQAVATAEGIRNWWTRDAVLDPTVGGVGEFGFYGHRLVIKLRVAELTPPEHVVWNDLSSTTGAFDGTTITFDLNSDEGITSLLFAHRGFKTGGNNVASATTRWGFYLLSLKRFLETGRGSPNPEDTELIR